MNNFVDITPAPSVALSQLRSNVGSPTQSRAAQYIQERAAQLNSRILSNLASRVADDPFGKVKTLIENLITRLMEEANAEADHKGWCDTELSTNEQTRAQHTKEVQQLAADIETLKSEIAQRTQR